MRSAPARLIAVSDSSAACRSSSQPLLRRRFHHRVLARHVVRRDRRVERLARCADDVEIRKRRLDDERVRTFLEIELTLAQRLAHVRRIHLVAATVAERRSRSGRFAERAVERGRVLRRVREDRRRLERVVVERLADREHAAVHHVARRDDVCTRLRVADRGACEQLEAAVVVHLAVDDDAAVPVRRVLAQTDVGDEHELGELRAERAQRALHDPVVIPRARRLVVLLVRDTEEDDRAHAGADEAVHLADGAVDGQPRHRREAPRRRAPRRRRRTA